MADQDNYSDIPQEVPASEDRIADPENVARGYKATLNNPRVSDEAKQRAREFLDNEVQEGYGERNSQNTTKKTDSAAATEKDLGKVARGLKAAISNPGVSSEAKESAKEKLENM